MLTAPKAKKKVQQQAVSTENFQLEKEILFTNIHKDLIKILAQNEALIAGGAIRSIFTAEPIEDYDLFFSDKKHVENVNKHFSSHPKLYMLLYQNKMCWTYKCNVTGHLYQVIKPIFFNKGDKTELLKTFDFICCHGYYDVKNEEFYLHPEFLLDNAKKVIRFNKDCKKTIITFFRIVKYVQRGYRIDTKELLEIIQSLPNITKKMSGYKAMDGYKTMKPKKECDEEGFEKYIDPQELADILTYY